MGGGSTVLLCRMRTIHRLVVWTGWLWEGSDRLHRAHVSPFVFLCLRLRLVFFAAHGNKREIANAFYYTRTQRGNFQRVGSGSISQ
jgi:hypothetical protein